MTRKITMGLAAIKQGRAKELRLGNLDAKRDWGFAGDYVEAMWLMLQQEKPDDYVVATGETHSVREFLEEAFSYVGLDWQKHVVVDPEVLPPGRGGPAARRSREGREPSWAGSPKVSFKELVRLMVDADLRGPGALGAAPRAAQALRRPRRARLDQGVELAAAAAAGSRRSCRRPTRLGLPLQVDVGRAAPEAEVGVVGLAGAVHAAAHDRDRERVLLGVGRHLLDGLGQLDEALVLDARAGGARDDVELVVVEDRHRAEAAGGDVGEDLPADQRSPRACAGSAASG